MVENKQEFNIKELSIKLQVLTNALKEERKKSQNYSTKLQEYEELLIKKDNEIININKVKKFSILIISEEFGAIIKECNAPKVITEKAKDNQNFGGYETFQNYRQKVKTNWKASKNI